MARQSSIDTLPEEVRRWLERALTEQNFSGYQALEEVLRGQGYVISKSAIHRYGQKIERRFAAIRASTEAARILTEGAADDQDARSEAVIALVQTEMFEAIVALQEAGGDDMDTADRIGLLSDAARNIASLARASVNQKRFRHDVQERVKEAAKAVEHIAAQNGLSDESIQEIRNRVMGIVS